MGERNLSFALIAALATALLAFPLLGLSLVVEGTQLVLEGADSTTQLYILVAVLAVFIVQILKKEIGMVKASVGNSVGSLINFKAISEKVTEHQTLKNVGLFTLIMVVLTWPLFFQDRSAIDLAILVLIYVMLGLGLNIVVGLAGLLDLGYVAFYAVGAYTYALLSKGLDMSFWACLPIAGALAALFGFLLGFPVLRLRGDYLAIVTLGFGEIIRILLNNLTSITGGPNGITSIPKPTLPALQLDPEVSIVSLELGRRVKEEGNLLFHEFFGIDYSGTYKIIFLYMIAVLLVFMTIFIIRRLMRMPVGRAWEALREDEIACRSLGLNRTSIKLSAFTIGATLAGFAGAFFAARQGAITPESFVFIESAIILAIVVLGGMGSQLGVILAAAAMTILPELARGFDDYRMLMFGGMMVLMMIWRPEGLVPAKRPHLELNQ